MNAITSREPEKGGVITANVAALAEIPPSRKEVQGDLNEPVRDAENGDVGTEEKELVPLFFPDMAKESRLLYRCD